MNDRTMEGERETKSAKPLLFIIFIVLLVLPSNIRVKNVGEKTASKFRSSTQLAIAADSVAGNALDPTSYVDLDDNNTCIPQPNGPLSRGHFVTMGIDYTTNIAANSSEAICMFDRAKEGHYPHHMQQLFGCFSFWHKHPTKQPVFALPNRLRPKVNPMNCRVCRNFLEMLKSQISLQIVGLKWLKERIETTGIRPYMVSNHGFDVTPYKKLHKYTDAHFHLNDTISSFTCTESKPRIGILNRANHSFRTILNAEQIATYAKGLSRDNHIPLGYFEDLDFLDQVAFVRSVDILISPHGAQLTGIAYMDAPCSHVFELFPKHYAIPYYFGSLAITSGKKYSFMYMSDDSFLVEQAMNKSQRNAARKTNLCPSIPTIIGYLQELVAEWNRCCVSLRSEST